MLRASSKSKYAKTSRLPVCSRRMKSSAERGLDGFLSNTLSARRRMSLKLPIDSENVFLESRKFSRTRSGPNKGGFVGSAYAPNLGSADWGDSPAATASKKDATSKAVGRS